MTDLKALTRIAKAVAADMAAEQLSNTTTRSISTLAAEPEHVFDLVDLLAKEGRKKRPSDALMDGYSFLLGQGLEVLRYAVDANNDVIIDLVAKLRRHLIVGGETGSIPPPVLLLVLHHFAAAKLDVGDDLRAVMQTLMENDADAHAANARGEGTDHFARIVEQFEGDTFAIHALLDESLDAMPVEARTKVVTATLAADALPMREATIGFLLNKAAVVRHELIDVLAQAAPHGYVSPTMLRRMIAMRNWLPSDNRDGLDIAIKAARKMPVDCAPWPRPLVKQVLASDVDGAGAVSLFVLGEAEGKPLIAGVLIKHGFGIRDAWVRRDITAKELRDLLAHAAGEIVLSDSTLEYARIVCCQALAINLQADQPIPFGLVDFAEAAGLADLNPQVMPVDTLVAELLAKASAADVSAAAVAKVLKRSRDWQTEYPALEGWYEDNVIKSIGTSRTAFDKQVAFLLAGPLQARRARWAELAAWMALSLKHRKAPGDWQSFAILARELLSNRPLDQIGFMATLAGTTIAAAQMKGLRGTRRAA